MYWRTMMVDGYGFSPFFMGGLGFLALWDLAWKGMALWRAARRKESWWFIALLLINSMGILPIIYLLVWGKTDPDAGGTTRSVKIIKKRKK